MIVNVSSPDAVELLTQAVAISGAGHSDAERFIALDNAVAFVDVQGEEVVGWCWGYVLPRPDAGSMAYLHELSVAESWRRRGSGRALVLAFAGAAADAGATKMFLTTGQDNAEARGLYDAIGGELAAQGPTVNYWFALPMT